MPTPTALLDAVAHELFPLLDELVFVGGATVGLLLTDLAAEAPRITVDVDVATHAETRAAFQRLEERMIKLGFQPDPGGPICRWTKHELTVDLMADLPEIQGFTNPWYASAIRSARPQVLPSGLTVRVMDAPHLVATKLTAWRDRGQGGMFSHDLEDILVVVDGRPELAEELRLAPDDLQTFVRQEVQALLTDPDFADTVLGFCRNDARQEILLERCRNLARSSW